ncbi:hypothetical protein FQA39_LY15489 [Lamprigera yunnana]|nr:hypothetical protein FQA39_LY15489 [Lamprigera yunnana]
MPVFCDDKPAEEDNRDKAVKEMQPSPEYPSQRRNVLSSSRSPETINDGNNPLEEYNQRQPTINVLEEVSQNIETKSSVEWPNQAVLLLLDQHEVNKTVHHHSYSWDQIQNKWKSLVHTYKSIKDHNSATGRNRKTWTFFEKIYYLMAKDPTVKPPTVVHLQTTRVFTEEAAPFDVDTPSSSGTITPEMGKSSNKNISNCAILITLQVHAFKKKRKLPELQEMVNEMLEQNERHHQEEMKKKCRFNDLLEILINNLKK